MKTFARLLGLLALALLLFASIPVFARNMSMADIQIARPTLTPTPSIYATAQPKQERAVASISLIADGDGLETAVYETSVEWEDEHGNWHIVESWQSPFNEYKQVVWAVAANDFGKGPFRWVVYQNGVVIKNSSIFYLPPSNNEIVAIHIDIP